MLTITAIARAGNVTILPSQNPQSIINSTSAGDTISFSPGTYAISSTLNFLGSRTYLGNGAHLKWAGGNGFLAQAGGNNLTLDSLSFEGAGLNLTDGSLGGISIQNCVLQDYRSGPYPFAYQIFFSGLHDSSITHCLIQHWTGDHSIIGYNPVRCHFDDNAFEDVLEGIHLNYGQTAIPSGCTTLRNTFHNIRRFALEYQGAVSGFDIAFNWAENFSPANHATLAFSLPFTGQPGGGPGYSNGVHVHHNYAGGTGLVPGPVDNGDQAWGFELGGKDTEFDHNIVNGKFLNAVCCTGTTPAWNPHDNVFAACKKIFENEYAGQFPASAPGNQILANMIPVPSAASITTGAYWNLNSGTVTPPPPPPPPTPTIFPVANSDGSVSVAWTGPGPLTVRGSNATDQAVFKTTSPTKITGLPPGWGIWFGDGSTEVKVTITGNPQAGAQFAPVLVSTVVVTTQPTTMPADVHIRFNGSQWQVVQP